MAVVKKHAAKMDDIRRSPERYDRVRGKIKTKNPYAVMLSSFAGSKRTAVSVAHAQQSDIETMLQKNNRGLADSPIRENPH